MYSPYAVPRDEPPQDLRSDVDAEFLSAMLQEIPIPVTALPPLAASEPWWMAYLAHEAGHHVQFDFDNGGMLEWFGDVLLASGGERWAGWNKELFADTFSLLTIGHWALWALAELIWTDTIGMLDDTNPRYPCPLVRLVFMEALCRELKLDAVTGMRGLTRGDLLDHGPVQWKGRDLTTRVREDLGNVDKVAAAVARAGYAAQGPLSKLCAFDPADFTPPRGRAHLWKRVLSGEGDLQPEKTLRSSRLVLSGGVAAWAAVLDLPEAQRDRRREDLAMELPKRILQERQEITRAAGAPEQVNFDSRNRKLGELLFREDIP